MHAIALVVGSIVLFAVQASFFVAATLFAAKSAWNLSVPYAQAARLLTDRRYPDRVISMVPAVDIALFMICLGASLIAYHRVAWGWSPARVAIIGVVAIVGSYAHYYVAYPIALWVVGACKRIK
jgi:hypothetical protein